MAQYQCKTCLAMTDLPPGADPHASTWCGCCTRTDENGAPHHHGRGAESCPGNNGVGHPGEACDHPNPKVCVVVSRPVAAEAITPGAPGVRPTGEDCPGGHCGAGVKDCAVCRPIVHFAVVGELAAT